MTAEACSIPVRPSSVKDPAEYAVIDTLRSSKPRVPIQKDLACTTSPLENPVTICVARN